MSSEIDAEAIIHSLVDRLVDAERRHANVAYLESMSKFELLKHEHTEISRILAKRENERRETEPKLHELWEAANAVADDSFTGDAITVVAARNRLKKALEASYEVCGGIPF